MEIKEEFIPCHTQQRVFSATKRGKKFFVSTTLSNAEEIAKKELAWFVDEFYFLGCGGPNHIFPSNCYHEAGLSNSGKCKNCNAVKKFGMVYPECLKQVAPVRHPNG